MTMIFSCPKEMADCVEALKDRRYVYRFKRTAPDEYVVEWDIF